MELEDHPEPLVRHGQGRGGGRVLRLVFDNSRINHGPSLPGGRARARPGEAMTVEFELDGVPFIAINGGPQFKFDEAISFMITCEDQAEVDYFWEKLTDGGEEGPCGWLKDRFGVSWQVVPRGMDEVFSDEDPERAQRAFAAMMSMSEARHRGARGRCRGSDGLRLSGSHVARPRFSGPVGVRQHVDDRAARLAKHEATDSPVLVANRIDDVEADDRLPRHGSASTSSTSIDIPGADGSPLLMMFTCAEGLVGDATVTTQPMSIATSKPRRSTKKLTGRARDSPR